MPRVNTILVLFAAFLPLAGATPASGQTVPPIARTVSLEGPRFGVTFLSDSLVERFGQHGVEVRPTISQFGWQFEKQFFSGENGVTAVTEWVALVGGFEQNTAIPSLSWMVGFRTREGAEFGIGPNISPAGTALVLAVGHTFRAGVMNIPVNIAVVPSKSGSRVTVLSGFNLRGRP
jgi:hypothetical protein